jgi:hypothetical protein
MSDHIIEYLKPGCRPRRALEANPQEAARLENQALRANVHMAQAAIYLCYHFDGCKAETDAGLRRRLERLNIL